MDLVWTKIIAAMLAISCVAAAEDAAVTSCEAAPNTRITNIGLPASVNAQPESALDSRPAFVTRRVAPPNGAVDFRILGSAGAPAILSLIAPDAAKYADFTFDGSNADMDVSHGGLNLRPLDGIGAVNVWSMEGNTKLRVGSRNLQQALDLWHTGADGHIRATTGKVILESPFETKSSSVLGGDTFIDGVLRTRPTTP